MALKPCPNCGNPVSEYAPRCPKCGIELLPHTPSPVTDNPHPLHSSTRSEQKYNSKSKTWLWIAFAAVIVLAIAGAIAYHLYSSRQADAKIEAAEKIQATADSIAAAEKAANALEAEKVRMDSIERIQFLNSFVSINDIIVRIDNGSGLKIPEFKNGVVARLKSLGYEKTDVKRGTMEGEGGEPYNYAETTYEKHRTGLNGEELWSKVVFNDGPCGGYTIEFCNDYQRDKFLKGARNMGYTHKENYGTEVCLRIPADNNEDYYDVYHENGNALIHLEKGSVSIWFGCI